MGSKSEAKALMQQAGVPLVPGYHGAAQTAEALAVEAERIGYPAMIKPSDGGGGKGMRVVQRPADFVEALQAARREAKARAEARRVGIECVSTCRARWSPYHKKKTETQQYYTAHHTR